MRLHNVLCRQELRKGKFIRLNSNSRDVLRTVAELQLPVESAAATAGVSLLPASTVECLLVDKRKMELVQPFKLALLKLASQEAARLMAAGEYELALPVALDAVQQGQVLFKPAPALQLFPLYLLAAQANLGLRRAKQCEDFLALASWLALKEPTLTTNVMKSQLSRLYGQLYAFQVGLGWSGGRKCCQSHVCQLSRTMYTHFPCATSDIKPLCALAQGRHAESVSAFAEDVYYCSLEYGPEDVRSSLGFYNMGKVFQGRNDSERAQACHDQVVDIWMQVLCQVVLGVHKVREACMIACAASQSVSQPASQRVSQSGNLCDVCMSRTSSTVNCSACAPYIHQLKPVFTG
jgi:hypothetical protein